MKNVGLLLDASSPRQFVALIAGEEVVASRFFGSDREMIAEIDLLMAGEGTEPATLSYVGVGVGPGSYTGLRVAQATAQGIALGCGIPVISLLPLKAYASEATFAVLLDARISGVYLWQPGMNRPRILAIEELEEALPTGATILTPYAEPLRRRLGERIVEECDPNLALLATQAYDSYVRGEGVDDTLPLLYLRQTQAEMAKNLRSTGSNCSLIPSPL